MSHFCSVSKKNQKMRTIYILFVLSFFACLNLFYIPLSAQGWKKLYSNLPAKEVALSTDGGYFLLTESELLKIDAAGEVVWNTPAFSSANYRMTVTPDGGLVYTVSHSSTYELVKLDASGNAVWFVEQDIVPFWSSRVLPVVVDATWRVHVGSKNADGLIIHTYDLLNGQLLMETPLGNAEGDNIHDLAVIGVDELAVLTRFFDQADTHKLLRIGPFGSLLSSSTLDTAFYRANTLISLPDGSMVVSGLRDSIGNIPYPTWPILVQKIAPDGITSQWVHTISAAEGYGPHAYLSLLTDLHQGTGLTLGADGYLYLAGMGYQGDLNSVNPHLGWGIVDPYLVKMDTDGNIAYERKLLNTVLSYEIPIDIIQAPGGELIMAGESDGRAFLLRTDSLGYVYSNRIHGRIARTAGNDCQLDSAATPLGKWIIQAGNNNDLFFGITDENGEYEIRTDSGDYLVTVFQPGPYWDVCQDSQTVSFPGFYLSDTLDIPVNARADCPYMYVDIASPFLRRCFNSTYFVNYCNNGVDTAYNVEIAVTLDPFLQLAGPPPIPWFPIDSLNFWVPIGQVAPGECGQFSFQVLPSCEVGLGWTHCTEARIIPDSLCLTPPEWEGGEVSVAGVCETGDSIRFTISNIGEEDLISPLNYLVVEDHMIMFSDQIQSLGSGQNYEIVLPATGNTYRLIADQAPGFPFPGRPTVAVEGCGGWISPGFVTQFAENEGSPFLSIDCQENVGAYDPNDKLGFPRGYDPAHIIEGDTELEYRIRFQNTGTDTAFNVLILDTLSRRLDLSSVRPGASSHSYRFRILDGGVLAFDFPDIMLPDSSVNPAGSQGFVNFRVAQTPGNSIGTEIYNDASIYFDFNEPIRTNQTMHTIGAPLVTGTVEVWEKTPSRTPQVEVFPNPFTTHATFRFIRPLQQARFQLFDLQGRSIRNEFFSGSELQLSAAGLQPGLLLFRISDGDGLIAGGKILLAKRR